MAERNKHIDDIYREGLSDYNEAPREAVWSRIEQNLDKLDTAGNTATRQIKGRSGKGYWFVLSGLLLITAASFFIYQSTQAPQHNVVTEQKAPVTPTVNSSVVTADNTTTTTTAQKDPVATTTVTTTAVRNTGDDQHEENTTVKETVATVPVNNARPLASAGKAPLAIGTKSVPAIKEADDIQQMQPASAAIASHKVAATQLPGTKALPVIKEANADMRQLQPAHARALAAAAKAQQVPGTKTLPAIKEANADMKQLQPAHATALTATATKTQQVHDTKALPAIKEVNADMQPMQPLAKTFDNTKNNNSPLSTITTPQPAPVDKSPEQKTRQEHQEVAALTLASAGVSTKPVTTGKQNTIASEAPVTTEQDAEPADKTEKKEMSSKTAVPENENSKGKEMPVLYASKAPVIAVNNSARKTQQSQVVVPVVAAQQQLRDNALSLNEHKEQVKSEVAASANDATNAQPQSRVAKMNLPFDMGVKLSYEIGAGQYKGNKAIISGYGEYSLSKKMCLLFEPGLMITVLNKPIDYGTNSYFSNGVNGYKDTFAGAGIPPLYNYKVYQQYDSLIASRKTTKNVTVGLDLPILAKYQFAKSFYALGGFTINISQLFTIDESISATYHTVTDTFYIGAFTKAQFDPLYRNYNPNHTSEEYKPVPQPDGNPLRLGYMVGMGYNVNDKMNVEFRMTQTITNQDYIPDPNIRNIYTQPYFRLTIGFNLYKHAVK